MHTGVESALTSILSEQAVLKLILSCYCTQSKRKFCVSLLNISLMKQHVIVTRRYTLLQERGKTWQILNRSIFKHVMFLRKYRLRGSIFFFFFVIYKILTEGVFVTRLSNNERISVWRIVWVTTNWCFVSDITCHVSLTQYVLHVCTLITLH
jgi:hypothetical protein